MILAFPSGRVLQQPVSLSRPSAGFTAALAITLALYLLAKLALRGR